MFFHKKLKLICYVSHISHIRLNVSIGLFPQTFPFSSKKGELDNQCQLELYLQNISSNLIFQKSMQEEAVEKIQYVAFEQLPQPSSDSISQAKIDLGLQSKQWHVQFQSVTKLRQANKYYSSLFINELLPANYKQIISQVDNLRSNNSKQALTLLTEVIQIQDLTNVVCEIIRPIVAILMSKSVSEKGFLKNQAMAALNNLSKKWNQWALDQLCVQTQTINGQISELAIKLIGQMLENNKQWRADAKFLKSLSTNLNGKRAVVQKKAKQILRTLKNREGQQQLEERIISSKQLLQQQSNTLRRELKQKQEKSKGPSLKQFLKAKKTQEQ